MKKLIPILTLTALLCPLMQAQEGARAVRPQFKDVRKEKTEQVDWASIKKRIEGAVERGDMTREQADQKYLEIKKKLAPPARQSDARPSPRRPVPVRPMANRSQHTALGRVVGELVAQKKINREDARRLLEAAHGTHPPIQTRPLRDQQHGATEELRNTLNAAKRELAMLREAREQLMEQHNDQKHRAEEHRENREHMEREQAARRDEMNRARPGRIGKRSRKGSRQSPGTRTERESRKNAS